MQDLSHDIIRQAAHGDRQAFAQIYQTYARFVYNVALRVSGHTSDAEEITQDVFMMMYQKLDTFRFQSSIKTWVYRSTVNRSLNYMKKNRRQKNQLEYQDHLNASGGGNQPNQILEQKEMESKIDALLQRLPEEQRICLILRAQQGLSYAEISEILEVNLNTVRTRIKRAREALMVLSKEEMNHDL